MKTSNASKSTGARTVQVEFRGQKYRVTPEQKAEVEAWQQRRRNRRHKPKKGRLARS